MKQLILNEINKQYIYYVMIVDIIISFQINEFRLKSILFFASLFIIYSLIKDDYKIWITLINNDIYIFEESCFLKNINCILSNFCCINNVQFFFKSK